MSAFVVSRKHIAYLVGAALHPFVIGRYSNAIRWHWRQGSEDLSADLGHGDLRRAVEVAQMLWEENIRSVLTRYPSDTRDTMPGPIGEDFAFTESDIPPY